MYTTAAILAGIFLDFLFGDPHGIMHPVILIGRMTARLEHVLRRIFPGTAQGRRAAGSALWLIVSFSSAGLPALILWAAWRVHPLAYAAVAALMSYQIMATKSLRDESMKVYDALSLPDLKQARHAVSMIVGRDTDRLDEKGVIKAAVETIAENASDGCIAPLFYLAVGGPALGFFYKAVNTMDSMLGYQNEAYLDFGRTAAKMDDFWNYVPARLSALLMTAAAFLCGLDGKNAWKIYLRDRKKSPSPNSAQTESVCAGALGVVLLGDAWYSGTLHHKEEIGDNIREIETEDIPRANRLLYVTVVLGTAVFLGIRYFILQPA
jgi:adenosylcobinamide-phosphate synthase